MAICKTCQQPYEITPEDLDFYKAVSPIIAGEILEIPPPINCERCRMQQRLTFRNERTLYFRKCDRCGKNTVSIYAPEKSYIVYCAGCFWKDDWEGTAYGREFDFTRPFFDQLHELWQKTPIIALWNFNCENSEFNNNCFELKDSYMNFNSDRGREIFYSLAGEYSQSCADCSFIDHCELCYQSTDCRGCYHCLFSQDLENSQDCYFSSNLIGCRNCFGSHGLRHQEYHIYNKKVSKEQWEAFMKEVTFTQAAMVNFQKKSDEVALTVPHRSAHMVQCENCTGDHIYTSKNAQNTFDVVNAEAVKNATYAPFPIQHVQDAYALGEVQWGYEFLGGGVNVNHVAFINNAVNGLADSYYSVLCVNGSKKIFGCVGLKKKEYCILNKQYTKEEYEKVLPQIVEHMRKNDEYGMFFPSSISPFAYNETVAQEYIPLNKEQAEARGYRWKEKDAREYIKSAYQVPEKIEKTAETITSEILSCAQCEKNYKITPQEFQFYKKLHVSVPRACPDCRHEHRMKRRNPRTLWERNCMNCGVQIKTTFSPDKLEKIFCEKCYLESVY